MAVSVLFPSLVDLNTVFTSCDTLKRPLSCRDSDSDEVKNIQTK